MATSLEEMHAVFVETSLETRLVVLLHNSDTVDAFKEKLCKEHSQCFPEVGDIHISALKVKKNERMYNMADLILLSKAFEGNTWLLYVDVVRVEEPKIPAAVVVQGKTENPIIKKEENLNVVEPKQRKSKKKKADDNKTGRVKKAKVEEPPSSTCLIVEDSESMGEYHKSSDVEMVAQNVDGKQPIGDPEMVCEEELFN